MNLQEMRELVLVESGRRDLERKTVGGELGERPLVDFYINAGSRWLDFQQESEREFSEYEEPFAIGDSETKMRHCRHVEDVWFTNSDSEKVALTWMSEADAMKEYPKLSSTDNGVSKYWGLYTLSKRTGGGVAAESWDYKGVRLLPPTEAVITLNVFGHFHAPPLDEEESENWWSVVHPTVLSLATQWQIEAVNRNREGMRDFEAALAPWLRGIDQDVALGTQAQSMTMKG